MPLPFDDPYNAFCTDTDAWLEGAADGPLSGLTFAAKDLYDVAGHVTGGGNPDWKRTHEPATETSWPVAALVAAGATMVGKTHTDELSRGIFGENAHYGTPVNPAAPDHVPGGSSSGSAAAVAGGLVDLALGTDTGGSVRVPSSFCGIVGMRTTHGRIPFANAIDQAPSFDTVGWFARDAGTFARAGAVLLDNEIGDHPAPRLIVASDLFAYADGAVRDALAGGLDTVRAVTRDHSEEVLAAEGIDTWFGHQAVMQGREAWETFGDWIDATDPRFGFEVAENYLIGRNWPDDARAEAMEARPRYRARIEELLGDDGVIALPTTPFPAPPRDSLRSEQKARRFRVIAMTCISGLAGTPQINLPLGTVDGRPQGLSLIGPRGGDELLIDLARKIMA
ncbi:MAG: amidase [Alphaproteobacteria bacterium]|nr:amidase [Alphaproteobacteria bacterium]